MPRLNKEKYIEKYGIEAWEIEHEKRLQYKRKWAKEDYVKNKDKYKQWHKKWLDNNKEKANSISKQSRIKKAQYYSDLNKDYYQNRRKTKHGRALYMINSYRMHDRKHELGECNLTENFILNHIFNSSCVYCGDSNWKHLGCDRIDNDKAHTKDNVVCSCSFCNIDRYYKRMSVDEFIDYRKTHPRELKVSKLQEIVEVNGIKVIKKSPNGLNLT